MAERMLQKPYRGANPYIFISYAHRNMDRVLDIIARMQADGYRIWYDEGIDPGTEWAENIAEHVIGCDYFIAFISKEYLLSDNCKEELSYARDRKKPRLLVYLEDVELSSGLTMRSSMLQAIHMYRYRDPEDFYEKLYAAKDIDLCLADEWDVEEAPPTPEPEATPKPVPTPPFRWAPVQEEPTATIHCGDWVRVMPQSLAKKREEALEALAQKGIPQDFNHDLFVGRHFVKTGDYEEALAWLAHALDCGEDSAVFDLLNLALLFDARGQKPLWERCCKITLDSWCGSEDAQKTLLLWAQQHDREQAIRYYTLLVPYGDPDACMALARYCEEGYQSSDPAISPKALYRTAALNGNIGAMLWMAEHVSGRSAQPEEQPWHWYRMAAQHGDPEAQIKLGDCCLNGAGGAEKDPEGALYWYQQAAKRTVGGLYKLGCYYHHTPGVKDPQQAVSYYQEAAQKGHGDALCALGNCYRTGFHVPKDGLQALDLYQQATRQGSAEALLALGDMLWMGDPDLEPNPENAVRWYQKAAEAGSVPAQRQLGIAYAQGRGVQKDKKAARQYLSAAANTDPEARYQLAALLLEGMPDVASQKAAVRWLQKQPATEKATVLLSRCYAEGTGVTYSPRDAFRLLYDLPCPREDAQYQLGIYYRDGVGCMESPIDAAYYLCQAMLAGHPLAGEAYGALFAGKDAGKLTRAGFSRSVTAETAGQMFAAVMKAEDRRYRREQSKERLWNLIGFSSATALPRRKRWYVEEDDRDELVPDRWCNVP